jgi:hypothetical protein
VPTWIAVILGKGGIMKEVNFNYITINSVGKELNDKLVAGFAQSGLRSKSSYLTQVLSRGLEAEAICESVSDSSKADAILGEVKGLRGDLSALSAQLCEGAAESEAYKTALCEAFWMLVFIRNDLKIDMGGFKDGAYDALPEHLERKRKEAMEAYGNAKRAG